jgi:membrane dipeptidase
LNRLGVMVDLSHTSDQTMRDAISISKAPVVWTHAGSRAVQDHPRNVPDDILNLIGDGPGKNPGIM